MPVASRIMRSSRSRRGCFAMPSPTPPFLPTPARGHAAQALVAGRRVLPLLAVGAAFLLGGCGLWSGNTAETLPRSPPPPAGVEASLRPLGSDVTGKIRVIDRGDGATLLVSMINVPMGQYRIAFGERGNCTSPNGFSAGPPWAPPGAGRDARDLVPVLLADSRGKAEASLHLRGVRTSGPDSVAGRSVVVFAGAAVTDARPDVPNNRIACGVLAPVVPLQF
jgi:Cu/Zn superoxide dismutase